MVKIAEKLQTDVNLLPFCNKLAFSGKLFSVFSTAECVRKRSLSLLCFLTAESGKFRRTNGRMALKIQIVFNKKPSPDSVGNFFSVRHSIDDFPAIYSLRQINTTRQTGGLLRGYKPRY